MNKKDYKHLDYKLLELANNNIISNEQYQEAKQYFNSTKKERTSIITIFTAIGILLIALSIITIFAFNWNNVLKEIKLVVAFIPIMITGVMMHFCIKNEDKKMQLYTSIFAPISILATNSLIAQIFHVQTEIFELIFTSLLMFLPIAFILRNYVSLIVYGVGVIIYSLAAINLYSSNTAFLNSILIAIPLFIYNVINYINDRENRKNIILWIINITIITLLLFFKKIFRSDVLLIYLYMVHIITQVLFKEDNVLNKLLNLLFICYLIISCTTVNIILFTKNIEFGYDTLFITILTAIFLYLSKAYKKLQEYFLFAFVVLTQYTKMPKDTLFIFVNIIAIAFGIYKIIIGNHENSYKQIMQGMTIVLLLILFRFMNSDLDFITKSIMFLITGAIFIISATVMKKRIGGNRDEQI